MEINLATLPTFKINDLRMLGRDRKISLGVTVKKEDQEKALRDGEEAKRPKTNLQRRGSLSAGRKKIKETSLMMKEQRTEYAHHSSFKECINIRKLKKLHFSEEA
ncbi:hypothetical protein NDU88_002602 [Pleurodeles waltl]|uniref:Uncharacterized protein n=1 Tax=Pleurodeles waltl TaxID=8319 RepID=A0AAV7P7G1_PLEWA|nr:hypothetical protein NDU88_002602 [Pleurodeles waltl]